MSDYSDIDLCFLLVDYGDTFLRQATTEMLRSAMRAMPGINIVQLHDSKSRVHPFANAALKFERDVSRDELAAFKGYAFAEQALRTDRPTIFCDVDLIFNNAGAANHMRGLWPHDLAIMRRDVPDLKVQPYNTGLILAKPGAHQFWSDYRDMCNSCKPGFREWWGDQIALAVLVGYDPHNSVRLVGNTSVELLDMDEVCPAPWEPPTKPYDSWCVHFKGDRRKEWLVKYARVLDGGKDFEAMDPNRFDEIANLADQQVVEDAWDA